MLVLSVEVMVTIDGEVKTGVGLPILGMGVVVEV